MSGKLTPKQKAFALAYVETGNASEAYRQAYDAENCSPETVKVNASKLLKKANVALTVAELQLEAKERTLYTVEQAFADLEEDRQLAKQAGQPSAAISATVHKAKMLGIYTDKVDLTLNLTDDLKDWLGDAN